MDFKKEKERLRNMNYAQFKEFIVGLARKDAMHHGEDFAVFYHFVRQISLILINSTDD